MKEKLEIPCSYQGGKQRLAKQIVDIFYEENNIDEDTHFYDLCCGSGAVSLELINRGFNPNNITMVDNGCFGQFWQNIANNEFNLVKFREEIDKLPQVENVQNYLKELSGEPIDKDRMIYHYLLLQAGAFGSKQIYIKEDKWIVPGFRSYWLPTETSNRKSPVNPMMPMAETLYKRVKNIVVQMSGCIVACKEDVFKTIYSLGEECKKENINAIVYIDPPYMNTTGYKERFNIYELKNQIQNDVPIYISEGKKLQGAKKTYLLSSGRTKGNISGKSKKKPVELSEVLFWRYCSCRW